MADRAADWVASALTLHDEVGPRALRDCLDRLAAACAPTRALDQVAAARDRIVFQARILMVLPVVVLLDCAARSRSLRKLAETPTGQFVLAGAVVALACGYSLMLWLARLFRADEREVPPR